MRTSRRSTTLAGAGRFKEPVRKASGRQDYLWAAFNKVLSVPLRRCVSPAAQYCHLASQLTAICLTFTEGTIFLISHLLHLLLLLLFHLHFFLLFFLFSTFYRHLSSLFIYFLLFLFLFLLLLLPLLFFIHLLLLVNSSQFDLRMEKEHL